MAASPSESSPNILSISTSRDGTIKVSLYHRITTRSNVSTEDMISVLRSQAPFASAYKAIFIDNDDMLPELYVAIRQNQQIDTLKLSFLNRAFNSIPILELFRGKIGISSLHLRMNGSPENYAAMIDVLRTLNLTSFQLSGVRSVHGLADVLATHDKLKIFKLGVNIIDRGQRAAFLAAMMRMVPILGILYRQNTNDIAQQLKTDSIVEILTLYQAEHEDLTAFADVLKTDTTLKSLSVSSVEDFGYHVHIGHFGHFGAILEGLRFNRSIIKLAVKNIHVDDVPSLIRMLEDNTTLEVLEIGFKRLNDLPQEMKDRLIHALERSNLLELKISNGNPMFEPAIRAVEHNRHNAKQKGAFLLNLLM